MKGELEAANTQIKNAQMLGGGKGSEELEQNITTLNEMISLLESDLNEEKEKNARFEAEIEQNATKLNESVRLERKLKSKDEEIETLKIELEAYSDAASFVEKLTLDLITKEDTIRDQTKRLKEFAEKENKLETELSEANEMVSLQAQEMEHLDEEVQKGVAEKAEQQKHIALLGEQINKYKQKIRELSDNNSSLLMNMEDRDDDTVIQNYFNVDIYQHKYYELAKLHQATQEQTLEMKLTMGSVRQYAGIFLANLQDTLPPSFSEQLHPHLTAILLKVASTNHHLYLLFEACSQALTHKSELYTAEQESVAGWLLLLLEQVPELYCSLVKIEFALTSADSEADIADILGHPEFKDELSRIDVFTQELLQRVVTETIDIEISIDPYTDPIDLLDQLSASIERLPTELATRHELCVQTMKGVQQILTSVELYRRSSEARETAQVDILL
jgi:myosin heavy subunit